MNTNVQLSVFGDLFSEELKVNPNHSILESLSDLPSVSSIYPAYDTYVLPPLDSINGPQFVSDRPTNINEPVTNTETSLDPQQFETIEDPTLPITSLEPATSAINETAQVAETAEVVSESALSSALGPAAMVAQAIGQGFNALNQGRTSDMQAQNQTNYASAMANGHGIGYQSVAMTNLANSNNAAAHYQMYSNLMTSILGPTGGLIASLTPTNAFASDNTTSFTATTASGEQTNAQSVSVVDGDSA